MKKEFVRLSKPVPLPDSSIKKRELDDSFWIDLIHSYLLDFYSKLDLASLKGYVDDEKTKTKNNHKEDSIKWYIQRWFKENKRMCMQGIRLSLEPKVYYEKVGFYDLKFVHSDWLNSKTETEKYYAFECKNIDNSTGSIKEYVYNPTNEDGGMHRYFNGKYAQEQDYGGMIGFVIQGTATNAKDRITKCITSVFKDRAEGKLLPEGLKSNTIKGNDFTFSSLHKRMGATFTLNHILFEIPVE